MRTKSIAAYSLLLGLIYLGMGLAEALGKYVGIQLRFLPQDIFGGFVLVVIGGVYLSTVRILLQGYPEGLAGPLVGSGLALIFATLYLLVMAANGLSFVLGDLERWEVLSDLRPGIWLALPSLLVLRRARQAHQSPR